MDDKPLCEWCSDKEYRISVLKDDGTEELLCNDCYKEYQLGLEKEDKMEYYP